MPVQYTPRLRLPYPQDDDQTQIPHDMQQFLMVLDGLVTSNAAGTFATRPAAGTAGRMYFATDQGLVYWDTGTQWRELGAPQVGSAGIWYGPATTLPINWLAAQGQLLRRADYPDLFTAIGTTHGAGDGSTTFALPDMRDQVPLGAGGGLAVVGARVGAQQHAHVVEAHSHTVPAHTHATLSTPNFIAKAMSNTGTVEYYAQFDHQHPVTTQAAFQSGNSAPNTGNGSSIQPGVGVIHMIRVLP